MDSLLLEMDILEVQNMLFRNMCRQGQHRQREIYRVNPDGTEEAVAYYASREKVFELYD